MLIFRTVNKNNNNSKNFISDWLMSAESFMHVEHQVGQPNNDDREDKNVSANRKLSPGKEIKRRAVEKEGRKEEQLRNGSAEKLT